MNTKTTTTLKLVREGINLNHNQTMLKLVRQGGGWIKNHNQTALKTK